MTKTKAYLKIGQRLVYDDGRKGHRAAQATVLDLGLFAMRVQFDDRASRTTILYTDRKWMNYLKPLKPIRMRKTEK
jgi:hypothetical protein